MSIGRRVRSLAVLAAAWLWLGATQAAAAPVSRLAANLPIGALPAACETVPQGATCTDAMVGALDLARREIGLGPYVLPADFDTLDGAQQIFILANLDRIAYGLAPAAGLSPTLAVPARSAMLADEDPDPTAQLAGLNVYSWTSDWAGDWANAPYAYYEWMYDDGYDGSATSNVDCGSPAASGCWDHRRNVLAFEAPGTLAIGASAGIDANGCTSYAMTLVWSPAANWTRYSYTWAEAKADGAGSAHASLAARHRHRHGRRHGRRH
jgi:hypothetical protein